MMTTHPKAPLNNKKNAGAYFSQVESIVYRLYLENTYNNIMFLYYNEKRRLKIDALLNVNLNF